MSNKSALTIGLSIVLGIEATPDDVAAAHTAIDSFYNKLQAGTVTSVQLQVEGSSNGAAAVTTTTTTTAAPVGELDKDGVPWDERIHAGTKTKTEKGVWKKRKGVDETYYNTLTAQLKASVSNTAPAAATTTLPITNTPVPGAGVTLPGLPGGAPSLPGLPALQPAVQAEYTELLALIGRNVRSPANPNGRITDEWVSQSLQQLGVADGSLQTLAHNPATVVSVLQQFKALDLS